MLLRRTARAAARAMPATARHAHTMTRTIAGAASALTHGQQIRTQPLLTCVRSASSKANAAAAAAAAAALPALPPTQLTYLSGSALQQSQSQQAVALFLTEEELSGVLASARAAIDGGAAASELTVDALLAGAGSMQSAVGLFDGAATLGPLSGAWTDFRAKSGETLWLYPVPAATTATSAKATSKGAAAARSYPRLLLVGLGAAASVNMATYRSATWRAVSSFQSASLSDRVGIVLPQPPVLARFFDSHLSAEIVATVARIAALSNHFFRRHLSAESVAKKKRANIAQIDLIDLAPLTGAKEEAPPAKQTKGKAAAAPAAAALSALSGSVDRAALVRTQAIVAEATCLAREWANERGDVAHPLYMEQQARALAARHGLKITVLQDAELAREGLQLIRAVGQAAVHKARLVVLEHNGGGSSAPVTALVGKGVTFDTGGLLIKGRGNMEGMHIDMAGSAAVLAVMQALPQLGYAGNVVGVLALAENAVGPDSYKPLAVLPSAAGSVEVCDTDAEGRLVLADAITYVQRAHSPVRLVDLATLTGASVVALGEGRAALFANDASGAADGPAGPAAATGTLAASLTAAGERVGERLWRMPIDAEHRDELKSAYADLRNCAPGRLGGACVAAAFLEKFVGPTVDWAHIDLAGPAMLSKAREWAPEGGTGFGAQLLLDWLTQQQRAESERDALEKFKDALGKVKQADMGQQ